LILVFLGTWLGYCNASTTLRLEVLGDPRKILAVDQNYMLRKMVARPVVVRDNFQEGFGHYTDQSTHLEKVKTNRRGPERLNSNGLDI